MVRGGGWCNENEKKDRVGEGKAEMKSESLCFIPRAVEVLNVRPA